MRKIVLLCAAGMSTSVLVKKMKEACVAEGLDYDINAYSVTELNNVSKDADMILLGPQIKFQLDKVKEVATCPVQAIDMQAYGMMNGKKVIEEVRKVLGD